MRQIKIGNGSFSASRIALGCMRIEGCSPTEAERLVKTALECGINFFDHADIYGGGRSEEVFAQAVGMIPSVREKMILQTKCGIRPGRYDFSKEHILNAVDGSLKRLKTDYVDVLLLHRPDTLMEPEEVAEAFDSLHHSGKVKYFGVSNQNPMTMELMSKYLHQKIMINQLQFGLMHTGMIDSSLNTNMINTAGLDRDGGVLEYCRLKDITIQPWSPFQYGFFEGVFLDNEKFPEVNEKLETMAKEKGVGKSALAIAWILRHPARMQPIVGTTNADRLKEICRADEVTLSREEWYDLYRAAGNQLP